MRNYTDETLAKGEEILLKGRVALRKYWLNFFLGGTFLPAGILMAVVDLRSSAVYFILALLILAPPFLRFLTDELVLTNRRLVATTGVIARDAVEIKLEKVESLTVRQGIFGRILNYGTVIVSGSGATRASIPAIIDPVTFKRSFSDAVESLPAKAA